METDSVSPWLRLVSDFSHFILSSPGLLPHLHRREDSLSSSHFHGSIFGHGHHTCLWIEMLFLWCSQPCLETCPLPVVPASPLPLGPWLCPLVFFSSSLLVYFLPQLIPRKWFCRRRGNLTECGPQWVDSAHQQGCTAQNTHLSLW